LPQEVETFAFALTGLVAEKDFQTKAVPVDFFYAKGIVEALADKLNLSFDFVAEKDLDSMHPGRTAAILLDGEVIGFVGQIHPQTAKDYGIPETYVAELNLTAVEAGLKPSPSFQAMPGPDTNELTDP
jgi:phenylalanyl-tRNA synthetase beta chain